MAESAKRLSPAEMLEQLRNNECVSFKIFDEESKLHGTKSAYCFVEGYDEPYYSPRVNTVADGDSVFIICGGKKGVIESYNFIARKPAYGRYKTLYFVDRDYDDNSALSSRIYVTDGYSVENYYCSEKAVERLLSSLCHITPDKKDILSLILDEYKDWVGKWIEATKLFCVWYANVNNHHNREIKKLAHRKEKRGTEYKTSFPARFASVSAKGIVREDYNLADLNEVYELADPVEHQELTSISSIYDIRGKYALQMLQAFIEAVRLNLTSKGKILSKPFSFECNNTTFLLRASACADTPSSLKNYLRINLV